jgi:hypothetical protein
MECFFACPYCSERISMVLDTSVTKQVCCRPIEPRRGQTANADSRPRTPVESAWAWISTRSTWTWRCSDGSDTPVNRQCSTVTDGRSMRSLGRIGKTTVEANSASIRERVVADVRTRSTTRPEYGTGAVGISVNTLQLWSRTPLDGCGAHTSGPFLRYVPISPAF